MEEGWGQLPEGIALGWVAAVACDSDDRVYVYSRSDLPMIIFDRDGTFVSTWGIEFLEDAHGLFIDGDDNLIAQRNNRELTALQDGGARVATRGDTVMAAFDVLDRTLTAARIRAAEGQLITLDEPVTMEAGIDYALRYRTYEDEADALGSSIVVPLVTRAGSSSVVLARTAPDAPRIGEIAHFGLLGQESQAMRIRGIEAGDQFAQVVHMLAAAPEIDT
ncbi:MAG TPA: hypothetical protein EYQ31_06705, partial [Candidatus Handelsmanbacteria bacterium]|nr:hypothetical protein [Candidatus Handelsmanbacteria bacterium]